MKRIFKVSVLFFLCVICISLSVVQADARTYWDGANPSYEEVCKDPQYWSQGYIPKAEESGSIYIMGEGSEGYSDTIAGGSCNHHAMAYALVKMGIFDPKKGDTPLTHIKKAREHNAFRGDWGYFEYRKCGEMYDGVEYVEEYHDYSYGYDDGLAFVKGLINEGYYVCACVTCSLTNGHLIFFDGVREDGKMSIGDSAFSGLTFEDIYDGTGLTFSYFEVMKYTKPSNTQPSIYDSTALRDGTSEDPEVQAQIENENIQFSRVVSEWELTGMHSQGGLLNDAVKPTFPGLEDIENLSNTQKKSLQAIKDNKEVNGTSPEKYLNIALSFVGLLMIVYAILLSLALAFDRVNNIFDFSLVSIFTFGKVRLIDKGDILDSDNLKNSYTSVKAVVVRCIILFVVGSVFLSGLIPMLIMKIIGRFI